MKSVCLSIKQKQANYTRSLRSPRMCAGMRLRLRFRLPKGFRLKESRLKGFRLKVGLFGLFGLFGSFCLFG